MLLGVIQSTHFHFCANSSFIYDLTNESKIKQPCIIVHWRSIKLIQSEQTLAIIEFFIHSEETLVIIKFLLFCEKSFFDTRRIWNWEFIKRNQWRQSKKPNA